VCGYNIVVAEGIENVDFSKVISMNDTSAYLWRNIQDKDFTVQTLVDLITQEYDVDVETATTDCQQIVDKWLEVGIVD